MNPTQPIAPELLADSWPLLHAHSLTIRALQPQHADLEVRFGLGLSRQSRYERFLGGGIKLTDELLARLVNVDYSREVALIATVAFAGVETPVGVVRYALAEDGTSAEVALTVTDEWQGCGLGRLLLGRVVEIARANGVRQLTGEVFATNARMLALARRAGFRAAVDPEDARMRRIVLDLEAAPVERLAAATEA